MKIEQKCHLMFLLDINYVILNSLDLREKLQVRSMEIAIKVLSQHSSPVISEENTVGIDHWYNIKIEMVSQDRRF